MGAITSATASSAVTLEDTFYVEERSPRNVVGVYSLGGNADARFEVANGNFATGSNSRAWADTEACVWIGGDANGNNNTESAAFLVINYSSGAVNPPDYSRYFRGNTMYHYIAWNGNTYNQNGAYGSISDRRLKQDIVDARPQTDDIKALSFKNYRMISEVEDFGDDAPELLGVIAQDLQASGMGGLVQDDGVNSMTVKTSVLYMKAVKALQETILKVEDLEARLAVLESA